MMMHLNAKTKLKGYYQCLWSNLLHYGLPNRCYRNRFFLSHKQIIQKDMQRFREIFNVFSRWFHFTRRKVAITVAIQFFDSIFDGFGGSFYNAALLLFFCQLPLRLKQKHYLRHDYRLETCLKKFFASLFIYLAEILYFVGQNNFFWWLF